MPDKIPQKNCRENKFIQSEKIRNQQTKDWEEIEDLVMTFQTQFQEFSDPINKRKAEQAATLLLKRFTPLFRKYITLIKTGQIDFMDTEMRRFVRSFIGEPHLKLALRNRYPSTQSKHEILLRFNFVKETYGALNEDDILIDLQMLFLVLAKRYKQMGRNFCAYVYNVYSYEVCRHIQKFIKNPANIHYRSMEYIEHMQSCYDERIETCFEDQIYETNTGMPDFSWINGKTCSDPFLCLSPLERKIIIKYYMEEYNDRQIAEEFGMHINTVNVRRRKAVNKLAEVLNIEPKTIRRNRRSGKKALFHTLLSPRK